MTAYYNEFDPAAAAILVQLIADGVIAPGDVDTRSIKDVQPDDLRGYTQCHFFAGGGLWSVAARLAGFPDDRELWTGSCPCQPFSAAGKGAGVDDPRHLWPDFFRLISGASEAGHGPPVIMGEQVSGAAGVNWLDGVRADLAAQGFASRARDIPACAVDAPHKRNRLYWLAVAQPDSGRHAGRSLLRPGEGNSQDGERAHDQSRGPDGRELGDGKGRSGASAGQSETHHGKEGRGQSGGPDASRIDVGHSSTGLALGSLAINQRGTIRDKGPPASASNDRDGGVGIVHADADRGGRAGWQESAQRQPLERASTERHLLRNGSAWADAEWIVCHDGKARRTKPGLRLLVDGLPGRVDLWRVGGNAIVPIEAAEVIGAYLDAEADLADRRRVRLDQGVFA